MLDASALPRLSPVDALLVGMAYLLVKHALADFFLQTAAQRREKGIYGKPGGLAHAAIHAALTAPVFLLWPGIAPDMVATVLAAEAVLHYHIDYVKDRLVRRRQLVCVDSGFWWSLGLDQLAHGLTYVGILWAATRLGTG